MTRLVDCYFSMLSPWAHLGHEPLLELAAEHGFAIGWKPLPLGALFAETGGLPLAKRSIQRQRYRMIELQRWAAKRGRKLNLKPLHWPFDPSLADRVAIALIARGDDPTGFIGSAMRGVWEEERDLASRETIAELLDAAGFAPDPVLDAADGAEAAAAYDANREAGREIGVFGSPTYVLDGEAFWGQDRLDLLGEALASGRPPYSADV